LMRKLNVRNVAQLLRRALHLGLLPANLMHSRW
jgi:DNA-binding CsgD family transcriptional regulator